MLAAAAAAAVLGLPAAGQTPQHGESVSVYYHVVARDGSVRLVHDVPATNEGIAHVIRFARYDPPAPSCTVIRTGRQPFVLFNPPRVEQVRLRWNGATWAVPTSQPADDPAAARKRQADRLAEQLASAETLLAKLQPQIAEAYDLLAKARGTAGEPAARKLLENLIEQRQQSRRQAETLRRAVDRLTAPAAKLGRPAGKVGRFDACPLDRAWGIVEPIRQRQVLPHHAQVWKLPPCGGRRRYDVAIAHPEPGRESAFYYVAYADTDGDGLPDKLVARSDLAQADKPGQWTCWAFDTDDEAVFVGNAWDRAGVLHFCGRGDRPEDNWLVLSPDIYLTQTFGGLPRQKCRYLPFLANIRVRLAPQTARPKHPPAGPATFTRERP